MTEKQKKHKAHTIYKNAAGVRLPGVTTILGVLNKPALVKWANNLGLQGIDSSKYVDTLAGIGTLAHDMIHCDLTGKKLDTSEYSKKDIELAENCLIKYYDWKKDKDIEVIGSEMVVISEYYGYGGTCDLVAKINGIITLLDIKTGKGIYDEMLTQVVAYGMALVENGYMIDDYMILRVGRSESEGFEVRKIEGIALHENRFKLCKELYELNKQIRRNT